MPMDISAYVLSRPGVKLLGLGGRAGAGKSTLARRLAGELRVSGVPATIYSGDWRFVLDSSERREWLLRRAESGPEEYFYGMNQLTWWNFEQIRRDLARLSAGENVEIPDAYDRATGRRTLSVKLSAPAGGLVIYENAILGGVELLGTLDLIILLNTPAAECLRRTLDRDLARRSVTEIAARFLMTSYSENIFLEAVARYDRKTICCDSEGRLGAFPERLPSDFLPVPVDALPPHGSRR